MKTIVIGGGPAGLMAAVTAAGTDEVILIEQNEKLGKKLYITGKGRCNVTNDCAPDDFLRSVVRGQKFLRRAVYTFPPSDTVKFFEDNGLKTKSERGNRVFPESDKASDITKVFEKLLQKQKVAVLFGTRAEAVTAENGSVTGVKTDKGFFQAGKIIVATGGLSYPATGSTGDGYNFAKALGHSLTERVPALTGIETDKKFLDGLQGLSLKNVSVSIRQNGRILFSEFGEMLFTHYGVSGPTVLSLSSYINRLPLKELTVSIDLKSALDAKQLDERILRDFAENTNKAFKNSLDGLLPKSLISVIIFLSGIDGDKKVNQITAAERKKLSDTLKNFEFRIVGFRGYDEAIITSGGVETAELEPKNMESKKIKGLHFAGEVIDADALTGGFNIQIALSTGYLAGKNNE